jgi:hypothetical protein
MNAPNPLECNTTTVAGSRDFRWEPENEDIIVPEQFALAIYRNHWGQVVLRQERSWDEDDDAFVRVNTESLPKVIARLQAILAEVGATP